MIFKNFRLIDYSMDQIMDLRVEGGLIREIGHLKERPGEELIEARGRALAPAFTDLHAHFRDPGYEYKEDIESGSWAALKGGFTSVNLMANTKPICDRMEVYDYVVNKSKKLGLIDIEQVVAISKGFDGKSLDHLDDLDERIIFLSDDGNGIYSDLFIYQAMLKAREKGYGLMLHEENKDFSSFDYRLAEDLHTIRDVYLAGKTGARVHFSHVSTKDSLEAIRRGKEAGYRISCEVTPHHLMLADESYRVNPPIRTKEDRKAVIRALADGTVDAIATDHAPHSQEDKKKGSPGMIGLETAFSIAYSCLVDKGYISINRLMDLMAKRPAEILKRKKGRLEEGYKADLVVLNLEDSYKFTEEEVYSKSKNSPFYGKSFRGIVEETYVSGVKKYGRKL